MAQTTPGSSAARPTCVGGLYEVCVGVPDLAESLAYYERFGCRAGRFGALDASAARAIYGVDSSLRSLRLHHLDADHGLVRLMQWERPRNDGLGLDPNLRCVGSRWGVRLTASVLDVANHAATARQLGEPVEVIDPILAVIGEVTGEAAARPFADPIVGVREMVVIQPLYRQVFFERFSYESPLYGHINPNCLFRTSQHTHAGMMIATDDHQVLRFYDEVLGLKRWFDAERPYGQATGSRQIFGLEPGETHWMVDFDDPRSGHSLEDRRSGKLKIVRFAGDSRLADKLDRSRPGSLGCSLYTWRVNDVESMWKRVQSSGATSVTDVLPDEFGTRSFSFVAPDGYFWTLLQA
ncbi:MAG: VOC family protein [Gammaproteobacteria bacterium]|nr:VOC family protein [Gammaproteobacteria bacterium]